MGIYLELSKKTYKAIWCHLVNPDSDSEEVAFVFVKPAEAKSRLIFKYIEWLPVPPEGFVTRSGFHLELKDEIRAKVIKRAHDLGASLAEFHFHCGPWPARFSPSDLWGFQEFVPHVWWRLKGKPYLAVVVSSSGFDALVWLKDSKTPQRLDGLLVGDEILVPTALTPLSWEDYNERSF